MRAMESVQEADLRAYCARIRYRLGRLLADHQSEMNSTALDLIELSMTSVRREICITPGVDQDTARTADAFVRAIK